MEARQQILVLLLAFTLSPTIHALMENDDLFHFGVARQEVSLSNLLFDDKILFEVDIESVELCAYKCFSSKGCYGFTVLKPASEVSECRGYSAVITLQDVTTPSPGARTFFIHERSSAWLKRECTTDAECPVELSSQCFANRCRCTPGYYYSRMADICIAECALSDLQKDFTDYPHHGILSNNLKACTVNVTLNDCKIYCLNNPDCRNLEYIDETKCCLHNVTALDVPTDWAPKSNRFFLQRTCV